MDEPCVAVQATPEDLRRSRKKCWSPSCKKNAWFEDWGGWRWCPYHAYRNIRWGGGNIWFDIKHLKLYWGGF